MDADHALPGSPRTISIVSAPRHLAADGMRGPVSREWTTIILIAGMRAGFPAGRAVAWRVDLAAELLRRRSLPAGWNSLPCGRGGADREGVDLLLRMEAKYPQNHR